MHFFLTAYLALANLRQQYREGSWWRVSYTQADHRTKMQQAQRNLAMATRALRVD